MNSIIPPIKLEVKLTAQQAKDIISAWIAENHGIENGTIEFKIQAYSTDPFDRGPSGHRVVEVVVSSEMKKVAPGSLFFPNPLTTFPTIHRSSLGSQIAAVESDTTNGGR